MPQSKQKYGKDEILYIDESGMNTNEVQEYGWSAKGKRCHALKSDRYGKRLNIISAVRSSAPFKFITPIMFEGGDRSVFACWLEYLLQDLSKNLTGQSQKHILILDNASIHKGKEINQ